MDFYVSYNNDFLCINMIFYALTSGRPQKMRIPETVKKAFQSPQRPIRCLFSSKARSIAVIRLLHKEMFA